MKEVNPSNIAKKIRNQLIYFIHLELMKKNKCHQNILINSMTTKELNDKYQKFSDYCVEKIETYNSSQLNNEISINNYYHISITYCSLNNNYNMLIDNKSTEKMLETNNIIGKYYKGNSVNIKTTTNNTNCRYNHHIHHKVNYNFIKNENENVNNLEKIVIGNQKFLKHRKLILSSFQITKNILLNDKENENENNDFLNKINSNISNNYKKLINSNINDNNNKKIETNFQHKLKKANNQKIIRLYTTKLKNYCSSLKILKKKNISHFKGTKPSKLTESNKIVKKDTIGKEKNKNNASRLINKDCKDKDHNNQKNKANIQNKIQNENIRQKIKNFTNVSDKKNPVKILDKKSAHRNRAQTKDKKIQKSISIKKMAFPSNKINSVGVNNEKQVSSLFSKYHKSKNGFRASNSINNKDTSSGVIRKKKFFNYNNNLKSSNNMNNNNNDIPPSNIKLSTTNVKKPVNKRIKRANTGINRVLYNFKGNEFKLKGSIDD